MLYIRKKFEIHFIPENTEGQKEIPFRVTPLFISSHLLLQYFFEPIKVALAKIEGRVEPPRKHSKALNIYSKSENNNP